VDSSPCESWDRIVLYFLLFSFVLRVITTYSLTGEIIVLCDRNLFPLFR